MRLLGLHVQNLIHTVHIYESHLYCTLTGDTGCIFQCTSGFVAENTKNMVKSAWHAIAHRV